MEIIANALTPTKLSAPRENADQSAPVYRLIKGFAVVHFDAEAKGQIVLLPQGTELRVVGSSRLSKCLEVLCQNQRYSIFEKDLLGPWSIPIKSRAKELYIHRAPTSRDHDGG